jgi:tetratricopeptide (TPR) repeat protein
MKRRVVSCGGVFAAMAMLVCVAPSLASGPEYATVSDAERCQDEKLPPDDEIAACSKNVTAGATFLTKETIAYDWYYLGKAYERKKDHVKAVLSMNAAIKLYPNLWQAYTERGSMLYELGSLKYALRDYDTAVDTHPGIAAPRNSRCWFRVTSGQDLDAALADCDEALRLEPDDANILDSRGLVHYRRGEYAAAIADCSVALLKDPKLANSLYVRGLAKLKTGDPSGGNADIASAKALDPSIADTYTAYGVGPY